MDFPGHGRSKGTLLGSVQEWADWIPDLLDSAGVDRAILVGHSMGSLIALDCAARHPERVSKLALLDAAAEMPVHPDLLKAANEGDPVAFGLIMDWETGPVGHFGRHPVPGICLLSGGRNLLRMENAGVLGNGLGLCNDYQSGMESASQVRCPTLVIAGEVDRMTPAKQGLKLCRTISDAQSRVIPKAGTHDDD